MNNELMKKDVKNTLSDVNHLRSAIFEFSVIGQNDPALGQMGEYFPFTNELIEFKHRSQDLLYRLEQFPGMISELGAGDARLSETAVSLMEMATEIKTELEWLETMQEQLNSVIDISLQELYQVFMTELTEAVEAVLAEIKTHLMPLLKTLIAKVWQPELVRHWLSSKEWKLHIKDGLFAF